MYNKNAAYDLSLFEEKAKKKNVVRLNTEKIKRGRRFRAKVILMAESIAVCGAILLGTAMFISGQARLSELTEESDKISKQIQEKESLYTQLTMKKRAEIENLGVCTQSDESPALNQNAEYICVSNKNKAEISDENISFGKVKDKFLEICNNLLQI